MGFEKLFLVALALVLILRITESFDFHERDLASEDSLWDLYERWQSHHNVSTLSVEDKKNRFEAFKQNAVHVHRVNQQDKPYKLKLNKFADMTNHEFGMSPGVRRGFTSFMYENVTVVPSSIDRRKKRAVTSVKEQGECNSCWAFSAAAAVEGINSLRTKELVSLSAQELLDCVTKNDGCGGGHVYYAFEFIKQEGITFESNYRYQATEWDCNVAKMSSPVASIDGYENVPANNEDALLKAVANQPVSVIIDGTSRDFLLYSGVFTGDCDSSPNHVVTIVGYGSTPQGTRYWIVKNSWGTKWGEKGYIRMERGISAKEGLYGIAMKASYPIKSSSKYPVGVSSY